MFDTSNKMTHLLLPLILSMLFLIPMVPVDGDGCYIPARPNIGVSEPGQKAVIAWNGTHERMYLSVDIWAEEPTEGLHVVPFPTRPTVALGNVSIFENITEEFTGRVHEITDEWYGADGSGNAGGGNSTTSIEIEFHEILGVHDLTVIKVKDVDGFKEEIEAILDDLGIAMESWPEGLESVICNYTQRGFPYFAIDRFSVEPEEMSIDPIMYEFQTDRVIFPLEISSPLDGLSTIKLSIITPEKIPLDLSGAEEYFSTIMEGRLLSEQVERIDPSLAYMFDSHCLALFLEGRVNLSKLRGDLVLEPFRDASWMLVSDHMEICDYTDEEGRKQTGMLLWSNKLDETGGRFVSGETGELIWETDDLFLHRDEWDYRNGMILEDLDGDDELDLIVLQMVSGGQYVSRFDGSDGSLLWRANLTVFLCNYHWTTVDEFGDAYLVMPTTEGIVSLKLRDGSFLLNDSLYSESYQRIDIDRIGMISSPSGDILIIPDSRYDLLILMDPISLEVILSEYGYEYLDHFYHKEDGRDLILCKIAYNLVLLDPQNGFRVDVLPEVDGRYIDHYHEDGDHFLIFLKDDRTAVKFDLTHGKFMWMTTFEKLEGYYGTLRLHLADVNGDEQDDVMLYYEQRYLDWWGYYVNIDPDSVYMVVLDGADGSPILTERRRVLHPGLDLDGDGEMEVLMDSPDEVQIVDPETGRVSISFVKEHVNALVRCPIVEDLNEDGIEDIVLAIFERSWSGYHYGYIADRLVIIDGRLCEQTGEIEVTGNIRNIDAIDLVDGGKGIVLQMEDQVIQFPFSIDLDLRAGSDVVDRGEGTTLILTARSGDGPMEGACVTWSSSREGEIFSPTVEWMPGMYMTRWTPSHETIGEVEITAMIRSEDDLIHWETDTTITVNGDVERVLPGWFQFTAWLSPDDQVILGNSTYAFVSVQGLEGEEFNISVEEVQGDGTIADRMWVSRNLWAYRYWPYGEAGLRNLLVKVSHGDDLLFVDVLSLELIYPEVEEPPSSPIEEQPLGVPPRMELLSSTAYPGSMISLLVISNEDLSSYQFESTDHDVGGFFTPFEPIDGGIWSCHYLVPEIEGSILLSVRIVDEDGPAWLLEDVIDVILRPSVEILSIVEPSFSMSPLYSREEEERTIRIYLSDEMGEVPIASFNMMDIPDGWSLVSIQLEEEHLVLVLISDGTSGGEIEILLVDGLGRSANLTIDLMWSLPLNHQGSGYTILDDYDETPAGRGDRGEVDPIFIVLLSAVTLLMGIAVILLIKKERTSAR